jgi:hypothetical protein
VGAPSEPDGAVAAEAKSGRHWTLDVIPLFLHYFSQKASQRVCLSAHFTGSVGLRNLRSPAFRSRLPLTPSGPLLKETCPALYPPSQSRLARRY